MRQGRWFASGSRDGPKKQMPAPHNRRNRRLPGRGRPPVSRGCSLDNARFQRGQKRPRGHTQRPRSQARAVLSRKNIKSALLKLVFISPRSGFSCFPNPFRNVPLPTKPGSVHLPTTACFPGAHTPHLTDQLRPSVCSAPSSHLRACFPSQSCLQHDHLFTDCPLSVVSVPSGERGASVWFRDGSLCGRPDTGRARTGSQWLR